MIHFSNYYSLVSQESDNEGIEDLYKKIRNEKESGKIGYYTIVERKQELKDAIETYIKNNTLLKKGKIRNIVVIGIGGSSLGAKAIDRLLHNKKKRQAPNLYFLENCDPLNIRESLSNFHKKETIFIVISKSGTTIETTSIFKYIIKKYAIKLGDNKTKDRLIVITDAGSPLSLFAKKYKIAEFNIPKNVGGRFSVLTHVGLVPLALAGFNIEKLIDGARAFEDSFFAREQDHLLHKAIYLNKNYPVKRINVLFAYASLFTYFNDWFVQLWGESLGKKDMAGNSVGLTPVGLTGSVDQHSFLQLIMDGPKDKSVTFLKIENFESATHIPDISLDFLESTDYVNNHLFSDLINAQCDATMESLIRQKDIPVDGIYFDKLNHKNVGALIYYFELLTSAMGILFHISTYDQPGVELGKQILKEKFPGGNQ